MKIVVNLTQLACLRVPLALDEDCLVGGRRCAGECQEENEAIPSQFSSCNKRLKLEAATSSTNRNLPFFSSHRPTLSKQLSIVHYRMVNWMQNIMKKSRRRQSQSPSSSETSPSRESKPFFGGGSNKHKRRAVRKDSSTSITEGESLCSQGSVDRSEAAAWRVGKFPI